MPTDILAPVQCRIAMPSSAPTLSKWLPSSATEFAPAPGVRPRVPYLWNEKLYGTLVSVGVYQADYAEMRDALPMGDTQWISPLFSSSCLSYFCLAAAAGTAVDAGTAGDRELSEGKFAESNTFREFSSDRKIAWALLAQFCFLVPIPILSKPPQAMKLSRTANRQRR